jgi:hypothetical protein
MLFEGRVSLERRRRSLTICRDSKSPPFTLPTEADWDPMADPYCDRLPTRWHETSIVVNDAVMISPPYGLDNCAAPKDKQTSLTRVHKILEGFYARRKQQQGGAPANSAGRPVVATPLGPRKGG